MQRGHPTNPTKTKNPIIKNGEIRRCHEDIKHSTRTVRPIGGLESTQSCVSIPIKVEEKDQTRTVRPVKVEELDIDFRVPGLSHAVVKEAELTKFKSL